MLRYSLFFCSLLWTLSLQSQPDSWSSRGVGGGGALFSPSINPANNDEFFVACDLSALFHTTDYGKQYDLVHFTELQAGHNSKVCYTATPGLRYCVHYANDQVVPVKSTDAGLTWNTLPGNPDDSEETFSIWADYNQPNRLLIAYYGLIYFSNNGGTTFSLVHTALSNGSGCLIGGAFFEGDNIYLGTNDGVIVSTNGGNSWNTVAISGLPANERIFSFAAAKSGNTTRFFCLTGDVGNLYVGQPGSDYWNFMRGVYSCDYGVSNWTPRMGGITVGTDFPMFVDMAENDINTVYLAGSNSSNVPIILKTNNAGVQWANTLLSTNNQNINTGWSGHGGDRGWSYGECPFGFDVAANDANRVIFGDFGFVHKTSNGGQSWQQAYVNPGDQHPVNQLTPPKQPYHSVGLENTTSWQVLWANATTLFAGFSDIKGVRSTDGGQTWSFNYSGLNANSTYRLAQHPNGTLFAATSNIHDMYQSTRLADSPLDNADAEGKLLYSSDNGASWQLLHSFGHPVFWIALDPNNPNRAYASVIHYNAGNGVGGVYRCDNLLALGGSTWTLLPNPPRTQKHPASIVVLNDGKVMASYSGRRNSSGVFTNSSGAFLYTPTTNTWQDVSATGMQYWTKDLVPAPDDAAQNTWYAAVFSGWGGAPNGLGGLYRTINRGQSWTKLTGSQFDRVTSITFNPSDAKQVYLTTEQNGLWITHDISVANPVFTLVESYPYRQPERVFFNPFKPCEIWISSFGNGIKTGNLVAATITPDGATTFCQGGSVQLSASAGGTYLWSTGATTQNINVSTSGNYVVTVSYAGGCSAASSGTSVTVNPLPTAAITAGGATTFCTGGSVQLNASAGSSYLWNNGATTASISVSTSGNYMVTVTNTNSCSAASSGTIVTVNPLPTAAITAGGATTFCQGGSVQLSASAGGSYLWNNGATTAGISVSTSGNYMVTVTNTNGCSAASSGTIVTVNPLPTAAITAGGATTFCQGGSVQLNASVGSSYLWNNGATTAGISVSTSGNYLVTVTNTNGCSAVSSGTSVTVNPLPIATITAGGATTFCAGGSVQLSASAGSSYLWSTGATTAGINVSTSGNYEVTITNGDGCSASSPAGSVIVYPLPPIPTITANGTILTSSSGTGNQWYLNGNIIPGATDQTLIVTQNGSYTVVVINNDGCISTSAIFDVINTGTDQISENKVATITPNPNTGKFRIEVPAGSSSLEIFDLTGYKIYASNIPQGISEIDISTRPNGIYFVRISAVWGKQTIRIIKYSGE